MATLLDVELGKLRTLRSAWLLCASGILLSLGIAFIILATVDDLRDAPGANASIVGFTSMFAAIVCALGVAGEYQHRTIATAFTLTPQRGRVIAAKASAAALVGIAVGVTYAVLSIGVSAIWLSASEVAWPWTTWQTVQAAAGVVIVCTTMAVAGVGFGGVARAPGGAVALVIIVYLVIESVAGGLVHPWSDYGITAMQSTVSDVTAESKYSYVGAALANCALAAAIAVAGLATVRRTDV